MQSRKTALATIEMTAMARWNRLTTRKVCDDSAAMARDEIGLVAEGVPVEQRGGGVGGDARREARRRSGRPGRACRAASARSGRCSRIRRIGRVISAGIGARLVDRGRPWRPARSESGVGPSRTVSPTERPSCVGQAPLDGDAGHLRLAPATSSGDQEQRRAIIRP